MFSVESKTSRCLKDLWWCEKERRKEIEPLYSNKKSCQSSHPSGWKTVGSTPHPHPAPSFFLHWQPYFIPLLTFQCGVSDRQQPAICVKASWQGTARESCPLSARGQRCRVSAQCFESDGPWIFTDAWVDRRAWWVSCSTVLLPVGSESLQKFIIIMNVFFPIFIFSFP